jgi:hypothetical protein
MAHPGKFVVSPLAEHDLLRLPGRRLPRDSLITAQERAYQANRGARAYRSRDK